MAKATGKGKTTTTEAAETVAPLTPPADGGDVDTAQAAQAEATAPLAPPADVDTAPAAPAPAVTAAAPLAAPQAGITNQPAAPLTPPVRMPDGDAFLGFVDEQGKPLDPDALFDMSGAGSIVTAKVRGYAQTKPAGVSRVLTSLAFTQGQEMVRHVAAGIVERARTAAK